VPNPEAGGSSPRKRRRLFPVPVEASAAAVDSKNVELVGQMGGVLQAVAVQGGYANVGVGPRLVILNISNPAAPVVLAQTSVFRGIVRDVAVAGNHVYVFPSGAFTTTVTLHNTGAEKGGALESTLALYAREDSQWVKEPTSTLDAAANTLRASLNHLGLFAILGDTLRTVLPIIVKRTGP